jgi:acetylornithine deacetylase/succinyl-diaminopimelate desuccinylase-like protein
MKFAIACYLKLLEDLKEELKKYNFGIVITSDEEIGGYNGVKALLEEGYKAKLCFLPDGGNEFLIEKGAKGVWHLIIESYGKSSHGSRPWGGLNAIDQLINFLNILRQEFVSEPCKDKFHYHNTLNIGKIEGGEVANKVPDFAIALIDIRFMPKGSKSKLKNKIYKIKNKFKNIKIKEKVFGNGYEVDLRNPYIKTFVDIIERKFKVKPSFIISHGTSDARFLLQKIFL